MSGFCAATNAPPRRQSHSRVRQDAVKPVADYAGVALVSPACRAASATASQDDFLGALSQPIASVQYLFLRGLLVLVFLFRVEPDLRPLGQGIQVIGGCGSLVDVGVDRAFVDEVSQAAAQLTDAA